MKEIDGMVYCHDIDKWLENLAETNGVTNY